VLAKRGAARSYETVREVIFERALTADPTRLLPRLEQVLRPQGYAASARSSHEFNFLGQTNLGPHRLQVRSDGSSVRFTFAPGAPGVALPDQSVLERVVDSALSALGDAPAVKTAPSSNASNRRCRICATPLDAGVVVCPLCGMEND
jgi:hypothetical protein